MSVESRSRDIAVWRLTSACRPCGRDLGRCDGIGAKDRSAGREESRRAARRRRATAARGGLRRGHLASGGRDGRASSPSWCTTTSAPWRTCSWRCSAAGPRRAWGTTTALASPQPLWALWRFSTMPEATRLTMEFMGLANHRKALRAEIVYYAERFREEQNKAHRRRARPLRRLHLGRPAGGLDGVRDQRFAGPGHGAGARHVHRPRRDIQATARSGYADWRANRSGTTKAHQFRIEQSAPLGP